MQVSITNNTNNRKWHTGYTWYTETGDLDYFEWRNEGYFVLFHRIQQLRGQLYIKLVEVRSKLFGTKIFPRNSRFRNMIYNMVMNIRRHYL